MTFDRDRFALMARDCGEHELVGTYPTRREAWAAARANQEEIDRHPSHYRPGPDGWEVWPIGDVEYDPITAPPNTYSAAGF